MTLTGLRRAFTRASLFAAALLCAQLAWANDPVAGAEIYRRHCMGCHGADGMATWPGAPNFARRERLLQPDATLRKRIRVGRGPCPAFRGILNDQAIQSVIVYIRTLIR